MSRNLPPSFSPFYDNIPSGGLPTVNRENKIALQNIESHWRFYSFKNTKSHLVELFSELFICNILAAKLFLEKKTWKEEANNTDYEYISKKSNIYTKKINI